MRHEGIRRCLRLTLVFAILALMLAPAARAASQYPAPPQGFVGDFANVLTADERAQLEEIAKTLEGRTTCEVAIVTVRDLGKQTPLEYRVGLFSEWGIGKKGRDNGLLILVATGIREIQVEVGYGLEPIVTDSLAGRYLRDLAVPSLRDDKYGEGLLKLTGAFADLLTAKYDPANPPTGVSTGGTVARGGATTGGTSSRGSSSASQVSADGWIWRDFNWLKLFARTLFPILGFVFIASLFRPHCPKCRHALQITESVILPPTHDVPGRGLRRRTCARCGFCDEREYKIEFIGHTSAEWAGQGGFGGGHGSGGGAGGAGGGGGFGGGSSGGGGAGTGF